MPGATVERRGRVRATRDGVERRSRLSGKTLDSPDTTCWKMNTRSRDSIGTDGTGVGSESMRCSFCQKTASEVRKLIAGPTVFICDECVEVCVDIIANDAKAQNL